MSEEIEKRVTLARMEIGKISITEIIECSDDTIEFIIVHYKSGKVIKLG
jgi:hypothetical protein